MRCLVTGGSGFLGSHLVGRLVAGGHEVVVFDRHAAQLPVTAQFITADLADRDTLGDALRNIESVLHLACTTVPSSSEADRIRDVETNVITTIHLLDLCVEMGVRKFVFSSSGGTVYGIPKQLPISETHPADPITSHGVMKLAIEKFLHVYHQQYGLDYVILRTSNMYGERQNTSRPQGVVGAFLKSLCLGLPITIWGDGSVVRDFVYAGDVAEAFLRSLAVSNRIFNIGSGRGVLVRDLLQLMPEVTGIEPQVQYRPARSIDVPVNVLDVRRAKEELGWEPVTPLEVGLRRTWEWLKSSVAAA